jgi:hypothetical protein
MGSVVRRLYTDVLGDSQLMFRSPEWRLGGRTDRVGYPDGDQGQQASRVHHPACQALDITPPAAATTPERRRPGRHDHRKGVR